MITIRIKSSQKIRAIERYPFRNLPGSFTEGESQIYGALGEILIIDYFKYQGFSVDEGSSYEFDLRVEGRTVEVKTKRTTVRPKNDYLCSVANFNPSQSAEFYFFVRVSEDLETGYLLGYYPTEKFKKDAFFRKAGEKDVNGWEFKKDCYNIKVEDLIPFTRTKKKIKKIRT